MSFNEPPVSTEAVGAMVEVFVPHGTLALTTGIATAHDDESNLDFTWVMNVGADRLKCWAERDGKAVVTVELLLKPLLSQMAEVALAKVQELEAADGD
jgi:hypothetical protein